MNKGLLVTASAILLGACASTPTASSNTGNSAATPAAGKTAATGSTTQSATPTSMAKAADQLHSVYFDFDNYSVKSEYQGGLATRGKTLAAMPGAKIKIEGNADERGSREYNLALGQKRAEAVKKSLVIDGVKDAQIETVSWGKEKPKAQGHDETAWAENRRADIVAP